MKPFALALLCLFMAGCDVRRPSPTRDAGGSVDAGPRSCDDGNACTVDRCDDSGAGSHLPLVCPEPANPCEVATACDPSSGCGAVAVADGTPCDPGRCSAIEERVCISGSCVTRPAPEGKRCADEWASVRRTTRTGHALAYDSARGRTVMFGGYDGVNELDETWEWDGAHWLQRFASHRPAPRSGASMIYDPVKQRTVMFGGSFYDETWEWDGSDWTQLSPLHHPPRRRYAGFTWDSGRNVGVLFGGESSSLNVNLADTWEWDGSDWSERQPAHSPDERSQLAMAYDASRQLTVLFGGNRVALGGADTWVWNGSDWSQVAPPLASTSVTWTSAVYHPGLQQVLLVGTSWLSATGALGWNGSAWQPVGSVPDAGQPGGFFGAAVYDAARGEVFVFDGQASGALFDGVSWSLAEPPFPVAREGATAAYDGRRHRVVMYGGGVYDWSDPSTADTWEWTGLEWVRLNPPQSPPPLVDQMMVRDSAREVLVLFGGRDENGVYRGDTWEWDGYTWKERSAPHAPPGRIMASMAYDSTRKRVVLFGGVSDARVPLADTWEWDGHDWAEITLATSPSERAGAAMAYDEAHQQMVMIGGTTTNVPIDELWSYDGASWSQLSPAHRPPPRWKASLAFDSRRGELTLYGGSEAYLGLHDTWAWNGADWYQRGPVGSPNTALGGAFAYDAERDQFVMFGGGPQQSVPGQDTWVYTPP